MSNDEIEKNQLEKKKKTQVNRVNLSNQWFGSWNWNKLIKLNWKIVMKSNHQ